MYSMTILTNVRISSLKELLALEQAAQGSGCVSIPGDIKNHVDVTLGDMV